jgi:hypothetical protein
MKLQKYINNMYSKIIMPYIERGANKRILAKLIVGRVEKGLEGMC